MVWEPNVRVVVVQVATPVAGSTAAEHPEMTAPLSVKVTVPASFTGPVIGVTVAVNVTD
jgi:hypothetical protein